MKLKLPSLLLGLALGAGSASVYAHFLVIYTPQTALLRASDLPFNLVFTHAFHGAPTMAMAKPQRFYSVRRPARGEPTEEVDLAPYLEQVQWQNGDKTVSAWKANVPRSAMRSLGDYQVVVEPEPYLEEAEGLYIQQFAKVMINVGGVPGNWGETLGLPAEIHALNKPYANWVGGLFRGIVLSGGIPVPFTQVEVEYLNHALDVVNNRFEEAGAIDAPHPSLEAMVIMTNADGEFSFALPKAGWWGFAALTVGPQHEYKGMPLSQDAILWVQATDLPE
jgi:cobalt/nickel transport protein